MRRRWQQALLSLAVLAGCGGAWTWQQTSHRLTVAASALTVAPDVSAAPEVLRVRLATAIARTRGRFSARQGLAELSRLYHANGFLDQAARCYGALEQLAPSEPRWPHLHATILAGYGEIEAAIPLWRRVVQLAPDYVPARLRLADCSLKSNQPTEAARLYADVLGSHPDNPYAQLGLARLDFEAERWREAQARLEAVVQQTDYTLGYDLIVTLYERTGQPERARAIRGSRKASGAFRDPPDPWLDEMMDVCFDPYRLALTAGFLARNGDPEQAKHLLERAVALAPDSVPERFQLAMLALTQGNLSEARTQFERCIRVAPDFADAWAQLSALQEQLGESAAAALTLAKGLAHCPQSPGLHLMQARARKKAGLTDEAIREYHESIRLRPNEAEAVIELAVLQINLGQTEEGIGLLQHALATEPGNPVALSSLAFFAIAMSDESTALRWLAAVHEQPRVPPEQDAKLRAAFEQRFGHPPP